MGRDLAWLYGIPALLLAIVVWWSAPWEAGRQRRAAAALVWNEAVLDSAARSMTSEGWRRLAPADCTAEECRLMERDRPARHPYAAAADFDGDGHLDLVMALTDGEADHVVWFHGTAAGFESPGLFISLPERGLRRKALQIVDGPALEIWDWEHRQHSGPYRWDMTRPTLHYSPRP